MISLLTYNISWEAMTSESFGKKCTQEDVNVCNRNIRNIISSCNCDFILLQEASGLEGFELENMSMISHNSGPEIQLVYFNKTKFTLEDLIVNEFIAGRPYMICHFKNLVNNTDLIIINVHLDRARVDGKRANETGAQAIQRLKLIELNKLQENLTEKIIGVLKNPETRVVIAGDFNVDFVQSDFTIFGLNFKKEPNKIGTCCNVNLENKKLPLQFDHILISSNMKFNNEIVSPSLNLEMHSDHNAIQCELEYIVSGGRRKHMKSRKRRSTRVKTRKQRGGVVCDPSVNTHISGLLHGTSLETFQKIVASGHIRSATGNTTILRTRKLNQGAYFQVIFSCKSNKRVMISNCSRPIMLVFSKALLNTYDYHISTKNCGGMLWPPLLTVPENANREARCRIHTYSKSSINDFFTNELPNICSEEDAFSTNEVVFDTDISLDYLEEVWICNFNGPFTQWVSVRSTPEEFAKSGLEYYRRSTPDVPFDPRQSGVDIRRILDENGLHRVTIRLIDNVPENHYTRGCDPTS